MKFRYKKYGQGILRPVIPIAISHKNEIVNYEVLVDSGADYCIFDAQVADVLGIDIKEGEKHEVAGITGGVEPFYFCPVNIKVGGWSYKIKTGFLRNIGRYGYGVVGQKGFFDIFVVKFDLTKKEIELKKRN